MKENMIVIRDAKAFCFNFGWPKEVDENLKVASTTFLLVSFLSVNESTYQTRESVFYFTSKTLFALEKIKF